MPSKTIYSSMNNPINTAHRFGNLPFATLLDEIIKYKKKNSARVPESDAILFYLSNHLSHIIKSRYKEMEVLPDNIAELATKCDQISTKISKALFFHVCCVGHGMLWVNSGTLDTNQLAFFEQSFGPGYKAYLDEKKTSKTLDNMSRHDMTIHQYLGGMSSIYGFSKIVAWGKPYSMIIKTLHKASNGNYSLYTAADHIWSLCHNGGTILNKGISNIFQVSSDFIFDILDIQDCGQIPNWLNNNLNNRYVNAEIKQLFALFKKEFPEEIKPLDSAALKKSTEKRVAAHKAMHAQYRQWWGTVYGGNAAPVQEAKYVPQPKINEILIGDFKKQKLI